MKGTALGAAALFVGSIAPFPVHAEASAGFGAAITLPDLDVGATFAAYNLLHAVGLDGSVLGRQEKIDGRTQDHIIGFGLGVNVEVIDGLYPGLGLAAILTSRQTTSFERATQECPSYHGEPHCQVVKVVTPDSEWAAGAEAKVTYVIARWVGVTVGYRAPFDDLAGGGFMFGVGYVVPPINKQGDTP